MWYMGKYWDNKEFGVYFCVCCGKFFFDLVYKFDLGIGWFSFWCLYDKVRIFEKEDVGFIGYM